MKKVSLRKCEDYNYDNVKDSIEKLIDDLGGLDKYIKPSSKVLIKPNLLMKKNPEDATTTHPMVVKVVCEKLLELNCDITIGDSPGGTYTQSSLKSIYKATGMEQVANELNIKLNYDISEKKVEYEKAHALRFMDIITPIIEADYIVNICKLKTHQMATFTGATKNLYGCIAGLKKAEIHYRFPTEELFCEDVLVDICDYVAPTINIMDGIVGMEGEGPSAGVPRHIGVVLASTSTHALDYTACKLIDLKSIKVPTLRGAIKRGYIKEDGSDIEILGDNINPLIIKDFDIPNTSEDFRLLSSILPSFLHEPITKMLTPKPVIRDKDCIRCKKCIEACPAKVMTLNDSHVKIDIKNCIKCYCCHELCPKKAIDIKRSFIFKMIK